MLLPVDSRVPESIGVRGFTRDAFILWKQARLEQGVVPGPVAVPRVSHPDVAREFDEIVESNASARNWFVSLAFSRIDYLRSLGTDDLLKIVAIGRGEIELDVETKESIAIALHNGWWGLRRALGLAANPFSEDSELPSTAHAGDKAWSEETDAEKDNDLSMVPTFCRLLAAYADSESEQDRALWDFLQVS
jgi:hypothetical protein